MVRDVSRHDSSSRNHCSSANIQTRQNRRVGSNRCVTLHSCNKELPPGFFRSRSPVVRKGGIRSDEYVILDAGAVPHLNPRLIGAPGTYYYIALDEHMCADIAIAANLRLGQDNAKLPDP